jgi:hypothetical protein
MSLADVPNVRLAWLSAGAFLLAGVAMASPDTTMNAISQLTDGQPQAPATTVSWPSTATTAPTTAVTWPVTSSEPYENPFTIYTSMTNSLGVITGMPAVWTSQPSQPALVTSQPPSATLPTYSGYYYNTTWSASSSTLATLATSQSSVNAETTTTSASGLVPTFAQTTGAASSDRIVGASMALVVAAVGFCML